MPYKPNLDEFLEQRGFTNADTVAIPGRAYEHLLPDGSKLFTPRVGDQEFRPPPPPGTEESCRARKQYAELRRAELVREFTHLRGFLTGAKGGYQYRTAIGYPWSGRFGPPPKDQPGERPGTEALRMLKGMIAQQDAVLVAVQTEYEALPEVQARLEEERERRRNARRSREWEQEQRQKEDEALASIVL